MFIDNLALTEGLLLFAAAVLSYMGVTAWWAMRKNNPEGVRAALRGGAIPVGAVGLAAVVLGLWSEMVWPYPSFMGGYNILFNDMTVLFGMVMVSFAFAAYLNMRLQYIGVFAFMAGAVTILYGWTGYGYNYTKEPFDFLLLYLGFGVAGIMALPSTVLVDYYLSTASKSETSWRSPVAAYSPRRRFFGTRAVQNFGTTSGAPAPTGAAPTRFRMPYYFQLTVLAFPVFMALAGIAAWYFLGTTVPGHLTPGSTP
jgi:putative membrane protein